jgi:hypothetical protein
MEIAPDTRPQDVAMTRRAAVLVVGLPAEPAP